MGQSGQSRVLRFLIFVLPGAGADDPIPGLEIGQSRKFGARLLGAGAHKVVENKVRLALGQFDGAVDDVLHRLVAQAVGIIPHVHVVARAVLGNNVAAFHIALGTERENVTGFAQHDADHGIMHHFGGFGHVDTHEHHADDFLVGSVPDGFIRGGVPGIDHQRAATIGVSFEDRGDNRVGRVVRV